MQPTKQSQALARYQKGDYKGAFRIFATFHIGFTEQERKCLKIAQECLAGHNEFYKMLGRDVEATLSQPKYSNIKKVEWYNKATRNYDNFVTGYNNETQLKDFLKESLNAGASNRYKRIQKAWNRR